MFELYQGRKVRLVLRGDGVETTVEGTVDHLGHDGEVELALSHPNDNVELLSASGTWHLEPVD